MDVGWEISLAVSQGHVGLVLRLGQVQRFVEILVDEVILRALLAVDVAAGRHADQVDLQRERLSKSAERERCSAGLNAARFLYLHIFHGEKGRRLITPETHNHARCYQEADPRDL